ncbi:Retinol dehydrogenase 13 [Coemansia aciculifera]|uniref:Retinol dehydrogenase 13 n=1 Tax=Coemansia aciculifera TaxID=417176 RepID=A0ACC1M9X3_9FUNG|nr:Retinol dehydrogenase 13 [Coemansia aciculifera]
MGLDSGANSLQSSIIGNTLGRNRVTQALCATSIVATDIGYAMISKLVKSTSASSTASRIDRIIMDSRNRSESNKVPNEQKTAVVTGANSGIGFETAKALGRAGYHTILACRNTEHGKKAVERLEQLTGLSSQFEFVALDLASLESVCSFIEHFKKRDCALDILVNNAGVACPYGQTIDGIEMQFGTNHVGHFALTLGLLDSLKRAADGARIVIVSSMAAYMVARISYDGIEQKEKFFSMRNYALSKLANMTFAKALAARLHGSGVSVNAVNPGAVATNLSRHGASHRYQQAILSAMFLDPPTGAICSIYAALSPDLDGVSGVFYSRCLPMDMHPMALDTAEQGKLWTYTEKLIAK